MKKYLKMMIAVLVVAFAVSACTHEKSNLPEDAVQINGGSYILPGDYPEDLWQDPAAHKAGNGVYVASAGDELVVYEKTYTALGETPRTQCYPTFEGGGLLGSKDGLSLNNGEMIVDEPCVSLLVSYSEEHALAVTTTNDTTSVHALSLNAGIWCVDNFITIEGVCGLIFYEWPNLTYAPGQYMYVLTSKTMVKIEVGDFLDDAGRLGETSVFEYDVPAYWPYLSPNSMIMLKDSKIYIGDRFGILAIDQNGVFTYYHVK